MKARKKCRKDKKQMWKTSLKGTRQRKRLRKRVRKAKIKIMKPRTFRLEDGWRKERSGIKAKTGRLEHGSYRKPTIVIPFFVFCLRSRKVSRKAVEVKGRVERSKNQDQSTTQAVTLTSWSCHLQYLAIRSCYQQFFWQSWWLPSISASQHIKHANEGHTKMKKNLEWKLKWGNTWPHEVFGSWILSSRLVAAT